MACGRSGGRRRYPRNSVVRMIRSLVLVGAVALAVAQPVATLGAPPAALPAYRPAIAAQRPAPASAPAEGSGARDAFKVPFDVDVGPRPLAGTSASRFVPSNWRGWQSIPGYAWYQPACYSNNGFGSPWTSLTTMPMNTPAPTTGFTIGSLVDDRSQHLLSPTPSYATGIASPSNGDATTSSPLTLQYGFQTTPCGAANFLNP